MIGGTAPPEQVKALVLRALGGPRLSRMAIAAALEANGVGGGSGGASDGPSSGSAGVGGSRSAPAPVRHCRQVQVGSFRTAHGRGAISPGGATTTVCD